jgi:hypothetical protein
MNKLVKRFSGFDRQMKCLVEGGYWTAQNPQNDWCLTANSILVPGQKSWRNPTVAFCVVVDRDGRDQVVRGEVKGIHPKTFIASSEI